MLPTNQYTLLSPVKLGGRIFAIGETIELTAAAAALLPAGRVKIVGDKLDELLEKPVAEILEAAATMPLDEISELGKREQAKGATAREELLGGLMKAYAVRQAKDDQARDEERAKAKEKAEAEAKVRVAADANAQADTGKSAKKK